MSLSRNELIEENLPIAGYITSEFVSSNTALDRDEIASVAFEALVNAPEKFRPGGMSFGAFARSFIRNRIRDYLRSVDTVGRRVREQVDQSRQVEHEMQARLGRSVTVAEVAEAMGVSAASLQSKRERSLGDVSMPVGAEETLGDAGFNPEAIALVVERSRFISHAVEELPEALARVVNGLFLEALSVGELAEKLGVSHAAVSARKAEALELLRQAYRQSYDCAADLPTVERRRVSVSRSERYLSAVAERVAPSPILV